jgi:hypothetical protein
MFVHRLVPEFVAALNESYRKESWWKTIMDDPDLHLGIRKDYLNIYYVGNSIIKLKYGAAKIAATTHYKFLLDPYKNLYIESVDGNIKPPVDLSKLFVKNLDELKSIKRASLDYAVEEKKGIQKILMSNPNIIDLEIALTDYAVSEKTEGLPAAEDKRAQAPRIDFAALQKSKKGWELVFFEAKLFANSALRASGDSEPKVVQQIQTYNRMIEDQMKDIKNSYIRVCKNLFELEGISHETKAIVQGVAQGQDLTISPRPRLIIFGFDEDQKKGKLKKNVEKLEELLKENPVFCQGKPNGFKKGIST